MVKEQINPNRKYPINREKVKGGKKGMRNKAVQKWKRGAEEEIE